MQVLYSCCSTKDIYEFVILISYHILRKDAYKYFTFSHIAALLLIFVLPGCGGHPCMYLVQVCFKQETICWIGRLTECLYVSYTYTVFQLKVSVKV